MYFINFCLVTVSTCLMVCILNPFIYLWLGEYMLFTNAQMLVIVASFYFSCIRDPVQIFLNAMGLFKQSRFIPVMRALLNLVFSLCLVSRFGVSGVFAGTILSTVAVPLVFEVLVLYKHGLHKKSTPLLIEMCKYIFISFSMCALCFLVTLKLPYTLTGLALRAAASVTVSCAALYGMYCNSSYYKYAKKLILGRIASKKR